MLPRGERLATFLGIGTSLATLLLSIIELPRDPTAFNVWLALSASLLISVFLFAYWIRTNMKAEANDLERKHITEEKRLREEFPAIFTFIESVGDILSQSDFEQFVSQLNHLLEIEKRARGIKWSEVKDIEAMKAIAYARLIAKRIRNPDN